jgi:hypothetical protein
MADYEVSGAYVDAVLRSLRTSPHFAAIKATLAPPVQALVDNPWSEPWHPALNFEAIGDAAIAAIGAPAFEELAYAAVRDRFGNIVLPMLKSTLASSNRSPAAILSKLEAVVKVAIRGIEILWKAESDNSGLVQVSYPRQVAPHVEGSWRGVLRYVFEVTQTTGRVERSRHLPHGKTIQYQVSW